MRVWAMAVAALLIPPGGAQAQASTPAPTAATYTAACHAPPQPATLPGATSITYRNTGKRDLRLHVLGAAKSGPAKPAILFFFGGGWRGGPVDAFLPQAKAFVAHGYVAALADYRVKCRDGTSPKESVADAKGAYGWLRAHHAELGIDPARMVVSGGSAGGHLAAMVGLTEPVASRPAAMILDNPAPDLRGHGARHGLTEDQARDISPAALPLDAAPPTIIFHGEADTTVPIAGVRAFCQAIVAAARRCELHSYAGQKHGFFHSTAVDPAIGKSPLDDTIARSLAFVDSVPALKR